MKEVSSRTKSAAKIAFFLFVIYLLYLLMRPSSGPLRMTINVRTQAMLKDLTLGIKDFQTEYGIYPLATPDMKDDLKLETSGDLVRILMGETIAGFNPRKIAYIEPPPVKEGKPGLTADGKVVDAWGNPVVILMETNGDNRLLNPDHKNTDPAIRDGAPEQFVMSVIAFSRGEDGIEGTKDDIASWR